MRQLQSVQHLAAMATPPPSSTGVHTDTFLILAAVLCFLLCVVGLALVARCSRLCNPSAFSVDTAPVVAPAPAPSKGLKKKALQSLPTVPFEEGEGEERPECVICLAEFARGDEIRVLPSCGHGFHSACVDVWLLSHSTCPSCRRALVIAPPAGESPPVAPWREVCSAAVSVAVQALAETEAGAGERARCRTSVP